ncbi:MAG: 5'/3'-nucleotidase SurE [candidate division Zixibacteria bacterium]|nr:5'/3'-nucleotidase SurE [candidate division Zixibacteria bacterium]
MSAKRLILITNDDGYFSDGINALFKEFSKKDEVFMVAPDQEQSASSHSLTLHRPLRMRPLDTRRFVVDGTPTDCVMLAMHVLFKKRKPDLIVSGINHGGNMGDDVTYSGTVAAAIEGAILKVPALAISMVDYEVAMPMSRAAKFVVKFSNKLDDFDLPPNVFLNINFPPDNGKAYRDYEFTKQGIRHYRDIVINKTDPRGRPYYWVAGKPKWKASKGSDFSATQNRKVSVTPVKLDFTDRETLERLKDFSESKPLSKRTKK